MSRIWAGFLWQRYSICTVLTGSETCSRGCAASFTAFQAASALSASSVFSGRASTLSCTALARDFTRSVSIRRLTIRLTSITSTPSLSSSLASSIFSRKLREKPPASGGTFIVMSLIRMFRIVRSSSMPV